MRSLYKWRRTSHRDDHGESPFDDSDHQQPSVHRDLFVRKTMRASHSGTKRQICTANQERAASLSIANGRGSAFLSPAVEEDVRCFVVRGRLLGNTWKDEWMMSVTRFVRQSDSIQIQPRIFVSASVSSPALQQANGFYPSPVFGSCACKR